MSNIVFMILLEISRHTKLFYELYKGGFIRTTTSIQQTQIRLRFKLYIH